MRDLGCLLDQKREVIHRGFLPSQLEGQKEGNVEEKDEKVIPCHQSTRPNSRPDGPIYRNRSKVGT